MERKMTGSSTVGYSEEEEYSEEPTEEDANDSAEVVEDALRVRKRRRIWTTRTTRIPAILGHGPLPTYSVE